MKVGILGSCVTRDSIEYSDKLDVAYYVARSSLASIYSGPSLNISPGELKVDGKGNFECRMLEYDVNKKSVGLFENYSDIPLLVDFIDERFDIMMIEGTALTWSNYLANTAFGRTIRDRPRMKPADPDAFDLWRKGADRFLAATQGRPRVLHRALWARRYRNDDTAEILDFEQKKVNLAQRYNEHLNRQYDYILEHGENIIEIVPEEDLVYSNFAHRWGVDYFHFSDDYYRDIATKLERAIEGAT